jgi:hypothetical protein
VILLHFLKWSLKPRSFLLPPSMFTVAELNLIVCGIVHHLVAFPSRFDCTVHIHVFNEPKGISPGVSEPWMPSDASGKPQSTRCSCCTAPKT